MYLHIGQNIVVPEADIIGVFDLDNTTSSRITKEFLSNAEKSGLVTNISDELQNSFVICDDEPGSNMNIYLSQLSTQTLLRRSEAMRFE